MGSMRRGVESIVVHLQVSGGPWSPASEIWCYEDSNHGDATRNSCVGARLTGISSLTSTVYR